MMAPISNPEIRLEQLSQSIARMPSLSVTMMKVLEICNAPETSPDDLNRVISLDPILAGKVLRLINSAYYSLRSPVTSLTRAVILLGINTVKNLALSAAVLKSLEGKNSFRGLCASDFWLHSLGVGVAAKFLAAELGVPLAEREEYFVAGLLHDLGKIPLNREYAPEYSEALKKAEQENRSLHQTEEEIFGFNHCLVGEMIIDKWQLGRIFLNTLRHHHHPVDAKGDNRSFISIVSLADFLINTLGIGSAGNPVKNQDILPALIRIHDANMDQSSLYNLQSTVLEEIEKAKIFLQISREN
ncbi:HD-like signal output (HDOD) domain, no enzymatic activity [Syntrophus gentianae]|uniref:HD-like signal output (HDOD) domain, no enzymatic activity n=1 Tax=Syntrophus gentianae TaxID=43775 RepID=A0A1H7UQV0_9BACT|nr:HDOD domain-containing protein [Syntrophus gentianae]SEL98767.1 HD-like signal output (HDOD) domain, no enzymatic activity [Syntrophus gentianae]